MSFEPLPEKINEEKSIEHSKNTTEGEKKKKKSPDCFQNDVR